MHLHVCLRSGLEGLNSSTTKNKKQNKTFLARRVYTLDIPKTLFENTASDKRCCASLKILLEFLLEVVYILGNWENIPERIYEIICPVFYHALIFD